jgi:outer membrane protein TolC
MKRILLNRLLGGVLILFPCMAHVQTITQEAFLEQLISSHPLFEKESMTSQIYEQEQSSYRGTEDWNVFASLNVSHEEPMIAIAGPEQTDAISVGAGVDRLIWATGGRLSASVNSSHATIELDPMFGFPESFYMNQVNLSYSQPLLKNWKGYLNRLQYNLKQYDIDFSDVQAKENIENFLKVSAAKFLDWVFLSEQKTIAADRLKLSKEELDRTKRKRSANLVDQADVIRAEDAVRFWRQRLVLAESQWKALQAELSILAQDKEILDAAPEFDLYQTGNLGSLEDATNQLKNQSRLLKVLKIRLDQLQVARAGYEETAKSDLSLITQFNIKKYDEDLARSLGMDKPDALIGLQYAFPVQNRTAKHQVEKTQIQIAQLQKQQEEIVLTLTSALSNIHIQIREMDQVLSLNREQIQSARDRTEEELKLYNQGRGDLTFVILSRDNEENAKLTYAANALTYHKLNLEYLALMDQLYE